MPKLRTGITQRNGRKSFVVCVSNTVILLNTDVFTCHLLYLGNNKYFIVYTLLGGYEIL